eukprot:scaffold964_cov261-Pinguiococcus_pyrenoidosus.AAC.26
MPLRRREGRRPRYHLAEVEAAIRQVKGALEEEAKAFSLDLVPNDDVGVPAANQPSELQKHVPLAVEDGHLNAIGPSATPRHHPSGRGGPPGRPRSYCGPRWRRQSAVLLPFQVPSGDGDPTLQQLF